MIRYAWYNDYPKLRFSFGNFIQKPFLVAFFGILAPYKIKKKSTLSNSKYVKTWDSESSTKFAERRHSIEIVAILIDLMCESKYSCFMHF